MNDIAGASTLRLQHPYRIGNTPLYRTDAAQGRATQAQWGDAASDRCRRHRNTRGCENRAGVGL